MKVEVKELSELNATLQVEISKQRFREDYLKYLREFAKGVTIKGFRKGEAPLKLVENRYGKSGLMMRALQDALPRYYEEALKSTDLEPIHIEKIEIISFEPDLDPAVKLKIELEVKPKIKLPDLSQLKVKLVKRTVEQSDIENQLQSMREMFASYKLIDRELKDSDRVKLSYTLADGERVIAGGDGREYLLDVRRDSLLPGLYENLIGMRAGQQKEFEVEFPEDFHMSELAGKKIKVSLHVKEVYERQLPELNDDLAKRIGGVNSLEELRDKVRADLERQLQSRERELVFNQVIEQLMNKLDIPIPRSLFERKYQELKANLMNTLKSRNISLQDYLRSRGITEEELEKMLREEVEKTVKTSLIIDALQTELKVDVPYSEVGKAIEGDDEMKAKFFQLMHLGWNTQAIVERLYTELVMRQLSQKIWETVHREYVEPEDTEESASAGRK